MTKAYNILQKAISDCGYWRWWTDNLPDSFQIEFGGVQLYQPPLDTARPHSGVFALRFQQPQQIEFLEFSQNLQHDWFQALQREEFQTPSLDQEAFSLGDSDAAGSIRRQAVRTHVHHQGPRAGLPVTVAFKAAPGVGLFVAASRVQLFSHTGEIPMKSIPGLHDDWWDYWRNYWSLKDTADQLPEDYACEVTIPAGD